jgi:hypothetical protein
MGQVRPEKVSEIAPGDEVAWQDPLDGFVLHLPAVWDPPGS